MIIIVVILIIIVLLLSSFVFVLLYALGAKNVKLNEMIDKYNELYESNERLYAILRNKATENINKLDLN